MKKLILFIFIIFFPFYIFAYSNYLIPGGESIGINIQSDGLVIVGYYNVNNKKINKNFKIGDRIVKVNNINISSLNEFKEQVNELINENNSINVTIKRGNKDIDLTMELINEKDTLKTGLYIKDSLLGVGTLTYIDPESKIYASLGHEIMFNEVNEKIEVKNGSILSSKIDKIYKSRNGHVGSKSANILFNEKLGNIVNNTYSGIYGFYDQLPKKETIKVGSFDDINKGKAYILTTLESNKVNKYEISIINKYYNRKDTNKAFSFQIVDKDLLDKAGGIIQGMSGSPIIQNNMIIGAVTNVIIDNVTYGYGISIITMLETGDNIRN